MRAAVWIRRLLGAGLGFWALLSTGCSESDMVTQPKLKPLQPSTFFADGSSARPVEPGTVARGQMKLNPAHESGEVEGKLVAYIPLRGFDPNDPNKLDDATARAARKRILERGRERFNIFCSPCHDRTGSGNGIIVQRGFTKPPSLIEDRLQKAPPGHFFKVMTNGYGAMYSYASRIPVDDRWAIVTYIRALQMSQAAPARLASSSGTPSQEGPAR